MPCPNCGGTLIGDGVTMVLHCENVNLDALDCSPEPDADPVYCEDEAMQHNETGREPTDAELAAIEVLRQRFARWWHEVGSGIAPMALEEWSEHAERVARAAWVDGAFLSGTRPMPKEWPITLDDVLQHEGTRPAPADEAATGEPTDTHVIRCESGDEITVPDWNAAQARVLAGPGEPTDAELLKELARQYDCEIEPNWPNRIWDRVEIAASRGREYLSGTRAMPDTPAPDEQDATLVKLIDLLTRTANAVKGQPGEMKQHGWADLPELCTALTARVAELEAELADAKRMVCAVQPSDDHESLYCHDTVFRGVPMNWFDARDKMLSAPGKEPTSE